MKLPRLVALLATILTLTLITPFGRLLAQTALSTTTLSAALAAPVQGNPQLTIALASGSAVSIGSGLYVDNEYMVVQSSTPQTTRWNVTRGQAGTAASAHASGAGVLIGAPSVFYGVNVVGPCTSTLEQALPHVNIGSAIYNCPAVNTLAGSAAASWDLISLGGYGYSAPARYTGWTYVTLGALTIQNGVQYIGSSGALAMTLAAPALWQNGTVMVLMASTAQTHTVTYTAGFWGNTTSSDVATYGGAIGDFLAVEAVNGAWRVLSQKNVTIA